MPSVQDVIERKTIPFYIRNTHKLSNQLLRSYEGCTGRTVPVDRRTKPPSWRDHPQRLQASPPNTDFGPPEIPHPVATRSWRQGCGHQGPVAWDAGSGQGEGAGTMHGDLFIGQ
jgi:hypothetical protein